MEMDEGNGQPMNDQAVVRGGISQIAPTRTIEDWRQQQHQHQQGGWSQRSSASQGSGYNTPTPQGQNSGQMYQQHQMQFGSQGQQGPSQQYTPRQGLFNSGSRPGSGLSRMGRQEAFDDAEYRDMAPSGLPPQYNGPASRTRDSYVPVFNNQDGSLALDIKNPATKHPRVQAQDQGMNNQAPAPATPQARKKTKKEADKEAIRILKAGLAPGYAYCSRCRKTALSEGNFTPKFDKKAKTLSKEMYADCNVCKEQRRVADLRKKEAKAAQGGGGNAAGVQAGNQDADEAQNEDEDEEMGDAEDEGGAPDNDHAPGPEGPPGPAFGAPGGPGGHPPHGDGGAGGAAGMDSAAEHPEHSFFVHHGEPQQAA